MAFRYDEFENSIKNDEESFSYYFAGNSDSNKEIDKKEILKKLKNFDKVDHLDFVKNAKILRTILCDYKEVSLNLHYKCAAYEETAIFEKGELVVFERTDTLEDGKIATTRYDHSESVSFNVTDGGKRLFEYFNIPGCFSNSFYEIRQLKEKGNVRIGDDAYQLAQAYKLFYDEDINFNSEESLLKASCMLSILCHFGKCWVTQYKLSEDERYYVATEAQNQFGYYWPIGKFECKVDPKEFFNDDTIRTMTIVGETVRTELIKKRPNLDSLARFATSLYLYRKCDEKVRTDLQEDNPLVRKITDNLSKR